MFAAIVVITADNPRHSCIPVIVMLDIGPWVPGIQDINAISARVPAGNSEYQVCCPQERIPPPALREAPRIDELSSIILPEDVTLTDVD